MLRALDVRDFVLVERVALEFGAGFGVLTGETGAGKSMLVDAIELLVGGRAEGDLVRAGAERAELSAEFELKDGALSSWLAEAELQGDPGMVVVRRTLDRSGRSRSFINGHTATLAQLREVGERLVDLHGQHEHQSLLRAAAQRELLDAHAGSQPLVQETGEAVRELRHYAERVDLDPAALREAEARIEALHAAARRHRVRPEALAARLAELEARLSELALSGDPEALKREVAAARGRYDTAAEETLP